MEARGSGSHTFSASWLQVDTEQNVVLISIASVMDPTLAPAGKHTLHAYYPATEPFERWEGLDSKSAEYKALKEERSQVRPCHLCQAWMLLFLVGARIEGDTWV